MKLWQETVQSHKRAWWKKKMGKEAVWNCRAGGIFMIMLLLPQPDVQVHMVSQSVCSRTSLRSLCLAREINSKEISALLLYPVFFFHGQDWTRPAFHQPPVSNSLHPRAPRKPNSPWHSTHGWYSTSSSLSCSKISFFSRGFPKVSHITSWADR